MLLEELKRKIQEKVESHRAELIELSLRIHANPEPGFRETKSSAWLADYLRENGFEVEIGISDLPTAFRASYGKGSPTLAFMAEYDVPLGEGHVCGHNIIGTAAVGAGIAAQLAVDNFGGQVLVMGCPAEEVAGKVLMVGKRAFAGIDAAMQIHGLTGGNWLGFKSLAAAHLEVEFFGKSAHAAAYPWDGISALGALVQAFVAVDSLRLHLKEDGRIHGIITDGGKAPNVIPEHSAGTFMIRAADNDYHAELCARVLKCFEAAATATGARLEYRWGSKVAAMRNNLALAGLFKDNLEALGRKVDGIKYLAGSTDTGNVSLVVPTIHPFVGISSETIPTHTPEFAVAAASVGGQQATIDGAKALAMTAADLLADPEVLARVKEEFQHVGT